MPLEGDRQRAELARSVTLPIPASFASLGQALALVAVSIRYCCSRWLERSTIEQNINRTNVLTLKLLEDVYFEQH